MSAEHDAESSISSSSKTCDLCNTNPSKYCCPRCEVLYCSLDCYKSESHIACSEDFYRDCVNEELASLDTDDESKKKMIEILKRIKNDIDGLDLEHVIDEEDDHKDSDDYDSEGDLENRIKGLDLGDADAIWNVLTEDERNEFEALLNEGDVSGIVPQWEPWWMYTKSRQLVEDVTNNDNKEEEAMNKCPQLMQVPEFSSLTNVKPSSPTIRYNITNVLASYAFVMRYFNGEIEPIEWVNYLLTICDNLNLNTNLPDASTAIEAVQQKCLQSGLIETDMNSMFAMKRDTFFLLQGPSDENALYYCRAALSHIHSILYQAKSALKLKPVKKSYIFEASILDEEPTKLPKPDAKLSNTDENATKGAFSKKFPDHKGDHLPKLDGGKLKKCMKKLEYYLSFVESWGLDFEYE